MLFLCVLVFGEEVLARGSEQEREGMGEVKSQRSDEEISLACGFAALTRIVAARLLSFALIAAFNSSFNCCRSGSCPAPPS